MNLIIHTTTAIGIVLLVADTSKIVVHKKLNNPFLTGLLAFTIGFISHAVLDYLPHCYPVPQTIDGILGIIMIITMVSLTNKKYRLITVLTFMAVLLPDLVDQWPLILNKCFGLNLTPAGQFCPWHWSRFSGSIYNQVSDVSTLNHIIVLLAFGVICRFKWSELKVIFNRKKSLNNSICFSDSF